MEPKRKHSFWTNPEGFSVVDLLAILFSLTYLGLIAYAVATQSNYMITLIQSMSPAVLVILGGYFTGQTVQQFNMSRGIGINPYNQQQGMYGNTYGNTGYNPYSNTPYAPTTPVVTPPITTNIQEDKASSNV
jgi:hypothetical protein